MDYLLLGFLIFLTILALYFFYLYQQEKVKKATLQATFDHLQSSFLANRRITYELAVLKEVVQNLAVQQNLASLSQNLLDSLHSTLPVPLSAFLTIKDLAGQNYFFSSKPLTKEQQEIMLKNPLSLQNQGNTACFPLERQGKTFGNLILGVNQPYNFSEEDLRMFSTITQQVALAIENLLLTEHQLAQSRHLASLGEVTAGIAHEIKNPLAIIRGFAECLPLDLDSPEEILRSSQLIVQEVDRLNKIIAEVLQFARPPQPDLLPSSLNDCLEKTLGMLEGEFAKKAIKLEINLENNLPKVLLDHEQIRQVFLNLILNSLEAMPEGGKIKISTYSPVPNQVVARFEDTGCGIAPENLEQIFRPFFSSKKKGTGLGLAISSRIIENHQGKIQVESKLGEGSIFYLFFLPLPD